MTEIQFYETILSRYKAEVLNCDCFRIESGCQLCDTEKCPKRQMYNRAKAKLQGAKDRAEHKRKGGKK